MRHSQSPALSAQPTRQQPPAKPLKILLPTTRLFAREAYRGAGYEAQDVLAEVADVDLLPLRPTRSFSVCGPVLRALAWHDLSGLSLRVNPGLRASPPTGEYDLFVFFCQHRHLSEVHYLNAVRGWSERCRKSVCIIEELWSHELPRLRKQLKKLRRFDLIAVALEGSVEGATHIIDKPCCFVPPAADCLRFTPHLQPRPRTIDAYSIGRRQHAVHEALWRLAEDGEIFYHFDTSLGGDLLVPDHRLQRSMIAALAKRSRCFTVAPALVDRIPDNKGQSEIANRYFEGAAAGAALLGQRPACESFDRLFDWPEAVIELRPDGSDCVRLVRNLLHDEARLREISRRNSTQALLKHDWVYRWRTIFQLLGLPPTEAMLAREQRLRELAAAPYPDVA